MASLRFSAAIVAYRTPREMLEAALRSLWAAILEARQAGLVAESRVFVVDNGDGREEAHYRAALAAWPPEAGSIELVTGHGNVGYGRANNLVLPRLESDVHLAMNPDIEIAPGTLRASLAILRDHPEIGLVAPSVVGEDGARQYLCRRYPSVWLLFLRGFAPAGLRRRFARALERYEMRDVIGDRLVCGIPLASGCFMLLRTPLFARLGGFDAGFFMYFEDYDLSVRLGREAQIAYVPDARIVHHGGEASRKGWRHVAWFVRSAWRFFARHGWKIA